MKTSSIICQRFICAFVAWLIVCLCAPAVFSQNVTILPSGITPNQLGGIQRLSYDAIVALPNAVDGDMAYDVTFSCVRYYRKSKWVKLLSDFDVANPSTIGWQIGGANDEVVGGLATDASGNVYVSGSFQTSAQFENTVVTGTGVMTLFIAKYNATGHLVWVQKIAESPYAQINDMALDASGNVYLGGFFYATAIFGPTTLTGNDKKEIFIAKFSNDGTLQWVQQAGGSGEDICNSLDVDGNGNIYLTGRIFGNVTFGGLNFISSGISLFIVKFLTNGSFQWLRRGTGDMEANKIAVDKNGKSTIIGSFSGNVSFGFTSITSSGLVDVFLVQYDSNGNLLWINSFGGTGSDYGQDVVVDSENNIIITGVFELSANFDSYQLISAGKSDVFIVKLNSGGGILWFQREGGSENEYCRAIAVDTSGSIYLTGDFVRASIIGSTPLYGRNGTNIFLAKYTKTGDFRWVKELGGHSTQKSIALALDAKGNVYNTGIFNNEFNFDGEVLTTKGQNDIYVLRIRD